MTIDERLYDALHGIEDRAGDRWPTHRYKARTSRRLRRLTLRRNRRHSRLGR